jgi:hypothetical protein
MDLPYLDGVFEQSQTRRPHEDDDRFGRDQPREPVCVSKRPGTILAAVLGVGLQGCASLEPQVAQTIRLQTPGCSASCALSNDRGSWQLSQTPGSVTVSVSRQPLRVICRADESTGRAMTSSRSSTTGSGAVGGGVAGGVGTGLALGTTALAFIPALGIVAVLTGVGVGATAGAGAESHIRPYRYPELVSIPMSCSAANGGSALAGPNRPALGLGIRGITLAEASAAGLGQRTAVLVISVSADGRAAASGLQIGDVILALNGRDLADAADLEEQVLALPEEMPLTLRVWRDHRTIELVLTRMPKETTP